MKAGWAMLVLTVAGCASGKEQSIAGVGTFCLPVGQEVADIPWVPKDAPGTPQAFAFAGCWEPSGIAPKGCPMPESIKGGVVSTTNALGGVLWRELGGQGQNNMFGWMAAAPDTVVQASADGAVLVVENKRLWIQWFVWSKAKPVPGTTRPHLEGEDRLLASCQVVKKTFVPTDPKGRDMISCERLVKTNGYALKYTFESPGRVPTDVQSLDKAVISAIESWRCSK